MRGDLLQVTQDLHGVAGGLGIFEEIRGIHWGGGGGEEEEGGERGWRGGKGREV